MTVLRYRN